MRRSRYHLIILIFIPLILLPGYMAWEAGNPTITPLHIDGAPDGIVFIADPHIKRENEATVREVIRTINEIQPRIVLIGGDFIGEGNDTLALQEIWKDVDAPVYAVLGNHDYKVGIQGSGPEGRLAWVIESVLRSHGFNVSPLYSDPDISSANTLEGLLQENGVTVLRNEWVELDMEGQRLILCGIDDIWACKADPPALPDRGGYRIYLVHEPYYREDWDADLILSGHTHGGQVGNGLFMVLDAAGVVDIQGSSVKGEAVSYVTRGIGTSKNGGDYRLFTSPEVVVINGEEIPQRGQ